MTSDGPPLCSLETHQAVCLKQGGLVLQGIGHNVLEILVNVIISTFEKQKQPLSFSDMYLNGSHRTFLFYEIDFNLFTTINVNFYGMFIS